MSYRVKFYNLMIKSKLYGWGIIWSSLVYILFIIIFQFTFNKPIKIEQQICDFENNRKIEIINVINNNICNIAKSTANKRLEHILNTLNDLQSQNFNHLAQIVYLDKICDIETNMNKNGIYNNLYIF